MRRERQFAAEIPMLVLLLLLPLAVEDSYFNITEAKAHMLTFACLVGWLCMLILCLRTRGICFWARNFSVLDIAVCCGGGVALLSCVCCPEPWNAFVGAYGWGIGGGILVSLAMLYWFLSGNLRLRLSYPVLAVIVIVALLSVLDAAGLDPLGFHRGISEQQYYYYLSTLGNRNAHNGYLCVVLPVLVMGCLQTKKHMRLLLAVTIAALAQAVVATTDGLFLGLGLCAFWAIPYACAQAQRLRRLCLLVGVYGALIAVHRLLPCFSGNAAELEGISAVLQSPVGYVSLLIVGWGGYLLVQRFEPSDRTRRWVSWLLEGALALLAVVLLIRSATNFSDSWGSHRGLIWRVTLESFADLPWYRKLLGTGPELQQALLAAGTAREWPVYVAHSEPLQILLSMGIGGFVCWCVAWGAIFVDAVKQRIWKTDAVIFLLPLAAYFGQSLLNSAYGTNAGLLCVALAVYRRYISEGLHFKSKN